MGYGISCLVEADQDHHADQASDFNSVVDAWEADHIARFDNLTVTIQAAGGPIVHLHQTDHMDHEVKSDGFDDYDPLKYFVKAQIFSDNIEDYRTYEDPKYMAYNVTSELTLTIDNSVITLDATVFKKQARNLNQKMCHNHHEGVWETDDKRCYYHYALNKLCIIVDYNGSGWKIVDDHENACLEDNWEDWEVVIHTHSGYSFVPVEDQQKVAVSVRSAHSPYLSYDEHDVDPTSNQLNIAGIVLICLGFVILVASSCFLCKRKSQYLKELPVRDDYNLPSLAPNQD